MLSAVLFVASDIGHQDVAAAAGTATAARGGRPSVFSLEVRSLLLSALVFVLLNITVRRLKSRFFASVLFVRSSARQLRRGTASHLALLMPNSEISPCVYQPV